MSSITMDAKNTIAGSLGECYIIIDESRYLLMQLKDVKLDVKKTKSKIAIMGRTGKGNKSTGWEGTGNATMYYGSPLLKRKMLEYMKTGEDFYFDMQITNDDQTSGTGRQTVIAKNCNLDSMTIAKLDASASDGLEESIDFTFDDAEIPEEFTMLDGTEA